jgi:acyl dehydratase
MELATLPQSALLYRLAAGDQTALHASPAFARQAGFERPLLHGSCSFGVTAHGLVSMLCDYDGDRLLAMDARFTAPVLPGDNLKVEVWHTGPGKAAFRTISLPRGAVVLDNGVCEFAA